jgi:hypothetical protein
LPTPKENLDTKIARMLVIPHDDRTISRRLFLYDFNQTFSGDPDRGFDILNQISEHFHVPFSEIQVCGSSQVGYSYFSNRNFSPQISDLDIAIVSPRLFQQFSEWTFWTTRRYTDLTGFQIRNNVSDHRSFRDNLSAGFFRPDLMPRSLKKDAWFSFFTNLSNSHSDVFKNVNAGIYLSEGFFEMRNANLMDEYRKARS